MKEDCNIFTIYCDFLKNVVSYNWLVNKRE